MPPPQMAASQPQAQQGGQDQAALQLQLQAQVAAQATAQAEADSRDRLNKSAQAKEWYQQNWLQSHVRSALFYALRAADVEDHTPVMRATLTPLEVLGPRPRDSPQGRFPAGLPDAVQEIFPQMSPDLTEVSEGSQKPVEVGKAKEGNKKRPLTAQVIRIRGGPSTATTFSSVMKIDPEGLAAKRAENAKAPVPEPQLQLPAVADAAGVELE